jgi:hypothetical protein
VAAFMIMGKIKRIRRAKSQVVWEYISSRWIKLSEDFFKISKPNVLDCLYV